MLTNYHILTNEGQNLITRALVENKAIDFMYYRAGDGDVATIDEIKLLTNISGNLIKEFLVANISKVSPSTTNVSGQYDNTGIETPVSVTEYGLFAKLDGDATEILFSYQGLGAGFILPAYSGTLITQIVDFTITMTQDVGVVVRFNPSALVDMQTFFEELAKKVDKTQIIQEPLNKAADKLLSATASNISFENGVGKAVSGYIEDGTQHNINEIWLSRNNKGEFKCIAANMDNFIDVAKWVQIDDLANASKLENLSKKYNNSLVPILSQISTVSSIITKVGETINTWFEFTVNANVSLPITPLAILSVPQNLIPSNNGRMFLYPVVTSSNSQGHNYSLELSINNLGEIRIIGHTGVRPTTLLPNVYYQCNGNWQI